MVFLQLSIKAELENVTNLVPVSDDFEYFFEVKCTSCNEIHPKEVGINQLEKREISGGKGGIANFVWRCGMCKRESWAKFEDKKAQPYTAENGQFGPLIKIECRGLEFIGFNPKGTWKCDGMTGAAFSEVTVEGKDFEWTDYDEKAALPVGISDFGFEWTRA